MELIDPLIGKELGNYRLDLRLGQGSCGVVYRGEHIKLGTPFAVKILHPILANNEESAARFLREARTAARLNHENVVFIADFDIEPGIGPYFVMEFLDGQSLRETLDAEAPLPSHRIANICEQICLPLAIAHRQGVIHRDLKPENIYLLFRNNRERVKLLDFGIAKITRDNFPEARELTRSGRVLGTPRYFSPEQAQGKQIDHRSDIYSFGIILYEMLTGAPTFDGQTPEEMILQHLTMPPPPLDPEKFPDELQDLVAWMLAKSPDERPDDMDEVWALLKEALPQIRDDQEIAPRPRQRPGQSSLSVLQAVDRTTGYGGDQPAPQPALINKTIPLGTDPARLPHLKTLSPAELEYLEQEVTLHEKEPPSSLRRAVSAQQAEEDAEPATIATPAPKRTAAFEIGVEDPLEHTLDGPSDTAKVAAMPSAEPSVVVDPALPSEFFEVPEEEQTAQYHEKLVLPTRPPSSQETQEAQDTPPDTEDFTATAGHIEAALAQAIQPPTSEAQDIPDATTEGEPDEHWMEQATGEEPQQLPPRDQQAQEAPTASEKTDNQPGVTLAPESDREEPTEAGAEAQPTPDHAASQGENHAANQGESQGEADGSSPDEQHVTDPSFGQPTDRFIGLSSGPDFSHLPPPPMVSEPAPPTVQTKVTAVNGAPKNVEQTPAQTLPEQTPAPPETEEDDTKQQTQADAPPGISPSSAPSLQLPQALAPPPPPAPPENSPGPGAYPHPGETASYYAHAIPSMHGTAQVGPPPPPPPGPGSFVGPSPYNQIATGQTAQLPMQASYPQYSSGSNTGSFPITHNTGSFQLTHNTGSYPIAHNTGSFPLTHNTGSFQIAGVGPDARMPAHDSSVPKSQAEVDALLDDSPVMLSGSRWQTEDTFFLSPRHYPVRFLVFCLLAGIASWWAYGVVVPPPLTGDGQQAQRGPCYARVRIQTTPSNAEIWLNNQRLGNTPYLYRDHCGKRITFLLRHPSYGQHPHIVQLQEGESEVTIPLYRARVRATPREEPPQQRKHRRSRRRSRYRTILLVTSPSGARVYYRGRRLCRTPCRLRGRMYRRRWYRLRYQGYRSRAVRIRFSPRRYRYRYRLRRR